jgi:polynucleotide 5'-hydroxyl-kinase GRC3/NOL9
VTRAPARRLAADDDALVEVVAAGRVIVVIGEIDLGKTTLVARLSTALHRRGAQVAVVDADVGQTEIGPPTTVALGRVARPLGRLAEAERLAMRFIGATSAVRDQLATIVAVERLVHRALALGFDHVLIDTSGLVRGDLGLRLKQAKIDAVDADVVVALDRGGECAPILAPYERTGRPRVVYCTPAPAPVRRARSQEERRRHREGALAKHFAGARPITLDLNRIVLRRPALFAGSPIDRVELEDAGGAIGDRLVWGERRGGEVALVSMKRPGDHERRVLSRRLNAAGLVTHALDDLIGMLAALEDETLEALGLAVVNALDFDARAMTVTTAADLARAVAIAVGHQRMPGNTHGVG